MTLALCIAVATIGCVFMGTVFVYVSAVKSVFSAFGLLESAR